MTPLETAGRALFGSAWQCQMAKALDVNERTVRRWYAGDSAIPDGIWAELVPLLRAHALTCRKVARSLAS